MVNQLIEILGKEAELFESFLHLLEQQKETMVANDLDSLREITARQQMLLGETRRLGKRREEVVEEIRQANAIEGDLTVTRLLDIVDQDEADRLAQLRDTILSLDDKIAQIRNTNAMLVNQSRQFISKTMAALARINHPEPATYSSPGSLKANDGHIMVDRRA